MTNEEIDRIIEQYAEERRHQSKETAQKQFLTRIYLSCSAAEAGRFLKHVRGLTVYYIDSLSLFDNPFRNAQVCWLAYMFLIFGFSIYMITDDDLRLAGMAISTGTVIFGTSLWKIVWSRWLDTDLVIACYREIIDLIDGLQTAPDTQSASTVPAQHC